MREPSPLERIRQRALRAIPPLSPDLKKAWSAKGLPFLQSIRWRVLALVVVSVLLPSLINGALAFHVMKGILEERAKERTVSEAWSASRSATDWVANRRSDFRAFTSSVLLQEELADLRGGSLPASAVGSVNTYLSYLLEDHPSFSALSLVTPGGQTLAKRPAAGKDRAPPEASAAPEGGEPAVVEVQEEGGPALALAQRVGARGRKEFAVLVGVLAVSALREEIFRGFPPSTRAFLVDAGGVVKNALGTEGTPPEMGDIRSLLASPGRARIFKGFGGTEVFGAAFPLQGTPWSLITESPAEETLLPVRDFRRQVLLLALVIFLALMVPALLVARTLILPMEELTRVARKIREGNPGLQTGIKAGGEMGELVASFNSMSRSLQASMAEIEAANEQLKILSLTDHLTELYNRRHINDRLAHDLRVARRASYPVSLIMLDIDHFKAFNDRYGHIAGDQALREISYVLERETRESDILGRYGGEEFIIHLTQTGKAGALVAAEKVRKAVADWTFHVKGKEARITLSLGVATFPYDADSASNLIEAADRALYHAKEDGRNRVAAFSGETLREPTPDGPGRPSPGSTPPGDRGRQRSRPGKG